MAIKPMKTSRTGVVTAIAVVSGLVVALALTQGISAQTAPPKAPVADEPATVKGAFDTDDGVARPTKPETPQQAEIKKKYSPYSGRKFPTRVFFGDTHHHTNNSGDALMGGNTLTPEQAYRFARGEEVVSSTGVPAKLSRPLDFLVVSDHAEGLGLMTQVAAGNRLSRRIRC